MGPGHSPAPHTRARISCSFLTCARIELGGRTTLPFFRLLLRCLLHPVVCHLRRAQSCPDRPLRHSAWKLSRGLLALVGKGRGTQSANAAIILGLHLALLCGAQDACLDSSGGRTADIDTELSAVAPARVGSSNQQLAIQMSFAVPSARLQIRCARDALPRLQRARRPG